MGAAVQTKAVQAALIAMRSFSYSLWPIRYKPLPDELLSCWLVRLAHGHGLKVQTFCNIIFGEHRQIWNRDIDRLAPDWLICELSLRTGTPAMVAFNTTLRSYEGLLYRKFRSAGPLHWILVLQMYHRKRNGYGLQFCPTCLAEDTRPYFRKSWRIAFNTVCKIHNTILLDRCPSCGGAIAVHRLDMKELDLDLADVVSCCHVCKFDLRIAPAIEPIFYHAQAAMLLRQASQALEPDCKMSDTWNLDSYSIMHQLCRTMTTRYTHARLREFILENLGLEDMHLTTGHMSFEMRSIEERHHLLQLSAWMLVDLETHLRAAWHAQAIRYSVLMKDFPYAPPSYRNIVKKFSNWRDRIQ